MNILEIGTFILGILTLLTAIIANRKAEENNKIANKSFKIANESLLLSKEQKRVSDYQYRIRFKINEGLENRYSADSASGPAIKYSIKISNQSAIDLDIRKVLIRYETSSGFVDQDLSFSTIIKPGQSTSCGGSLTGNALEEVIQAAELRAKSQFHIVVTVYNLLTDKEETVESCFGTFTQDSYFNRMFRTPNKEIYIEL